MKITSKLVCILLGVVMLFAVSCGDNTSAQIVKEYDSAKSAADVCGISEVTFVPEGFKVSAYRTVYDCVSETEYRKGDAVAVLRIVDAEYTTTNLSGFTDTALADVYTYGDGREFEIESRDGVFACEWQDSYENIRCNISFALIDGEETEFRAAFDQLLNYLDGGTDGE